MKQVVTLYVLLLFCNAFLSPLMAQQDTFIQDYVERLKNSCKYLMLVAETMPEDNYSFKATPESLSFAEHLMHIAWAMDWHSQSLLGERKARDWETDIELRVQSKSKEEMIAAVEKMFDGTITLIEQFDVSKLGAKLDYFDLTRTKRQILLLLADHVSHHREQMLFYLRLKGYAPPRYVLFQ